MLDAKLVVNTILFRSSKFQSSRSQANLHWNINVDFTSFKI